MEHYNIIIKMVLFFLIWYVENGGIRSVISYQRADPTSKYKDRQMLTTCPDVEAWWASC